MKVSHECPRALLEESRKFNDYDYALVHKFKDDTEYYEFFKESLRLGRTVYLDNSLFELEKLFDHAEFAYYVKELGSINPDKFYYIVPDALEDFDATRNSFTYFLEKYSDLPGKSVGVVQGKHYEEIKECYEFMSKHADMIAISFDYSYYANLFGDEKTKFHSYCKGRPFLIEMLQLDGVWNFNKPHHLLGCSLPQEFKVYNDYSVVSVDTSNPVVMGIKGYKYSEDGLETKESIKLVDLFEAELDEQMLENIEHNVKLFKQFIK